MSTQNLHKGVINMLARNHYISIYVPVIKPDAENVIPDITRAKNVCQLVGKLAWNSSINNNIHAGADSGNRRITNVKPIKINNE